MKIQKLSILLFFILLIVSCKKEQVDPQEGPTTNTNVFKGHILMFDEGTQQIGKSGVTAVIQSSGTEIGKAVSDSKGEFAISVSKEVKEFTVIFSKPGMGNYKEYFRVIDQNQLEQYSWGRGSYIKSNWQPGFTLGAKSTATISNLTAEITNNQLIINYNLASPVEGARSIRLLIQKDLPNISINTVNANVINSNILLAATTGQNTITSCLSCFIDCRGFKSGDKIYMTVYGESTYSNAYLDLETNKPVYSNLNYVPNNTIVSVIIP